MKIHMNYFTGSDHIVLAKEKFTNTEQYITFKKNKQTNKPLATLSFKYDQSELDELFQDRS